MDGEEGEKEIVSSVRLVNKITVTAKTKPSFAEISFPCSNFIV
jgi:hypothetical protein